MTQIHFQRPEQLGGDRKRLYRLYVDEKRVGKIRIGSDSRIEVEPGSHTVQVKIDWTGSARETILVEPGDTKVIRIATDVENPKRLLGISWLRLDISS